MYGITCLLRDRCTYLQQIPFRITLTNGHRTVRLPTGQIIGGTSGGSICAFLAWYGLLTDEPLRRQLLDEFWGGGIAAKTFLEDVVLQEGGLALLRSGRILQTDARRGTRTTFC